MYNLQPILHDKYTLPIQCVGVLIADIKDSQSISQVVGVLNRVAPDPSLKHLKKVRRDSSEDSRHPKIQVLLGKVEVITPLLDSFLKDYHLPISNIRKGEVPSSPALTRTQYEDCKDVWPMTFHEDLVIKRILDGTGFTVERKTFIEETMKSIITLSQEKDTDVAVIVNGTDVIAQETGDTEHHPLHHSIMKAVDVVAQRQKDDPPSQGYICSGMEAFLSHQPCIMCGMALLHSRIAKVFFFDRNEAINGDKETMSCPLDGTFSRLKLHCNPLMNHSFEVWKVS